MVSNVFFIPTWGNAPIWLYNVFQLDWSHLLDFFLMNSGHPVSSYKWGVSSHGHGSLGISDRWKQTPCTKLACQNGPANQNKNKKKLVFFLSWNTRFCVCVCVVHGWKNCIQKLCIYTDANKQQPKIPSLTDEFALSDWVALRNAEATRIETLKAKKAKFETDWIWEVPKTLQEVWVIFFWGENWLVVSHIF